MFNPFLEDIESYRFETTYRTGKAGWDIGKPQPAIKSLVDRGELHGDVLDIGCGTGENALLFASRGHMTLGIDFSPSAIHLAKKKAQERNIAADFLAWNALQLSRLNARFDTVVDSACYHCLNSRDRQKYAEQLGQVVKPGGKFFLLASSSSVPLQEISQNFTPDWNILTIRETVYQYRDSTIDAHLVEMQKK